MNDHTAEDRFDPNRLFDTLLHQLDLENDEALSRTLHVESYLIKRIRQRQHPLDSSLLIRINEASGINMRELRHLMGDRRTEYRLETNPALATPAKNSPEKHDESEERKKFRRLLENDDAGLPNFVQWS